MKLWLLRPVENDSLWEPWYDKAFGFVVRAKTENEARSMAQKEGGDELRDSAFERTIPAWLDSTHSTCVELTSDGDSGIIMTDFHAA